MTSSKKTISMEQIQKWACEEGFDIEAMFNSMEESWSIRFHNTDGCEFKDSGDTLIEAMIKAINENPGLHVLQQSNEETVPEPFFVCNSCEHDGSEQTHYPQSELRICGDASLCRECYIEEQEQSDHPLVWPFEKLPEHDGRGEALYICQHCDDQGDDNTLFPVNQLKEESGKSICSQCCRQYSLDPALLPDFAPEVKS